MRGRRIDLRCGNGRIRATLESLQLDRRGEGYGGRLRLRDAEWQGLRAEAVSVVAGAVTLAARPDLTLTLTAVEVEGRTDLVALLERVNPSVPGGWQLGVSPDGWITARRARGGLRLVVEPVVVDGRLTLELCGAGWRGRLLQLPRRLRVTRRLDLPHLGGGVSVSEAQRCGDVVEFRLRVPTVERCLDPGSLIEAVSRDRGRRP